MPSPNVSELAATAFEYVEKELADNVSEQIALLNFLQKKGNIKTYDGGSTIRENLQYQENGTYKRYRGWDTLNISPQTVISAAEFDPVQIAISVAISGLEQLQNSGKSQILDLLESRIKNMKASYLNNLSADLYSDGTAYQQIGGMQHIIADSPGSGTVGGISDATWTFWQNYAQDATTDLGAAATSSNIQGYMTHMVINLTRGADSPSAGFADNNYWKLYHDSLQAIQRITDMKAKSGWKELEYMGMPVILDGGKGGDCPTNHMYFPNLDYLFWRPHRSRNFKQLGGNRESVNQDGFVRIFGTVCQLTCSNRSLQGVLKD